MASPHVAGVAALVRAVDPGATPSQVVEALRNGARPLPSMAGLTVTGGVVDAVGAMDAALATPNTPPPPPPPPTPTPTPPNRPGFGKVSINRRGVVSVVVRGDSGNTGVLTLTANITAARVRNVGRKAFRIGSRGRTTVKVKLKRPARRQLRRKRTLRIKAKAVVKNAAGLTNSRTARIRLTLRRR
jgi:subtilisin family serine protease